MADAAPGRFCIGIGSSSNVIVERWNGVPLSSLPEGQGHGAVLERGTRGRESEPRFDTFSVNGFRRSSS